MRPAPFGGADGHGTPVNLGTVTHQGRSNSPLRSEMVPTLPRGNALAGRFASVRPKPLRCNRLCTPEDAKRPEAASRREAS